MNPQADHPDALPEPTRWAWLISLAAVVGAIMVLGFLLALATDNSGHFEQHYDTLTAVNITVATVLLLVIGGSAIKLLIRVIKGRFGSRLLLKLAGTFALVGLLPGVIIYTVSYQFVTRSIESWFDVKVEGALEAGLALGRTTLEAQAKELSTRTRLAADRIAASGEAGSALALERVREQLGADDVAIMSANGQVLLSVSNAQRTAADIAGDRPPTAWFRSARSGRVYSQLEGLDDDVHLNAGEGDGNELPPLHSSTETPPRIRALALIPSSLISLTEQERFIYVNRAISPRIATQALAVQTAYKEYQQRQLGRQGLRRMYIGTLTLTLILAVFGAMILAFGLARQLAQPLLVLAEGMRQVARGDLNPKTVVRTKDELGGLTRSFADMTAQLSEARAMVQASVAQVEGARTNLQTILDNLTAGVIVFDPQGRIDTVNPGATRIVRLPLSAHTGQRLEQVPGLEAFAQAVWQRFDAHTANPSEGERGQWQDAYELPRPGHLEGDQDTLTLLVRGADLPDGFRLMVFDDITEVVSAQRSAAWAEVARRLAHEIKNPLTPIQLSAERLQHKLSSKLEGADQSMLARAVNTIVNQVQAMKTLVNEFRDYARLPAAKLSVVDMSELVHDIEALYGQDIESGRLQVRMDNPLPLILGDGTQLRQVIHNLVQNAFDAVTDLPQGQVRLSLEAMRNEVQEVQGLRLRISDNGPGFAEKVLKRAFEPYVTTKSKGTGLGLAVVKKIADEHGARVRLSNLPSHDVNTESGGAQVSISFLQLAPINAITADEVAPASAPPASPHA